MEDLHQPRVDGSVQRIRYYLGNQRRKLMMVRAQRNNARRKSVKFSILSQKKKKGLLKSQERDG